MVTSLENNVAEISAAKQKKAKKHHYAQAMKSGFAGREDA